MNLFARLFRPRPVTKIIAYHATCPICAEFRRKIDLAVKNDYALLERLNREDFQRHLAEVNHEINK